MKKYFLMAVMAITTLSLVSCGDDDESGANDTGNSAELVAKTKANQISVEGLCEGIDIKPQVETNDAGTHYVSFQCEANGEFYGMICDIDYNHIGKTIDLTTGTKDSGQFMIKFDYAKNTEQGGFDFINLSTSTFSFHGHQGGEEFPKTVFVEGSCTTSHVPGQGFKMDFHGTFQDGTSIAMKFSVPESDIVVW